MIPLSDYDKIHSRPGRPAKGDDIFSGRLVKLRDVERSLADYFHHDSRPSRNTIIGWIEEGTLSGKRLGTGNNYYVYETSLANFIERLQPERSAI